MKHDRWLARRMLCKCDFRLHDGSRAREKLAVIVVQAPALFEKVLSILQ